MSSCCQRGWRCYTIGWCYCPKWDSSNERKSSQTLAFMEADMTLQTQSTHLRGGCRGSSRCGPAARWHAGLGLSAFYWCWTRQGSMDLHKREGHSHSLIQTREPCSWKLLMYLFQRDLAGVLQICLIPICTQNLERSVKISHSHLGF